MTETTSFRDPGGYVTLSKDRVIRTIRPAGRANLNACLNSAVAQRYVESGALISTHPLQPDSTDSAGEAVVEHPRIPFGSYPHEWPSAMLHAAGRLTIDLCSELLEEGRGLKDATPSNILFRGPRPVFIDVLSFEERDPLDPIWLPSAQFARTFLIPLLLERRTGSPSHECFPFQRDGVTPESVAARLPFPRRWFPPDLTLVTLPARAARLESDALYRPHKTRDAGEAQFILGRYFRGLRKKLDGLAPLSGGATVPAELSVAKREFVQRALGEIEPARVIDIGSKGGEFSLMAAAMGASVVSIDRDPGAVAGLWRSATTAGSDILPLVVDFARPTPPLGWRGEHAGFAERAEGFFDCALLLGATHELMVTDQIPLGQIFEAVAALTTRWLVVEYVGPGDPLFRRAARGRDAMYEWYSRASFEECAGRCFDIVSRREMAPEDRVVYLMRRKS